MPAFRLLLLGPVCLIDASGAEVSGLGAKSRAMLAFLAVQPGRRARREIIADLLWDGPDARHALRQTLLVLRQRFGAATTPVTADQSTVTLGPGVETDLEQFEGHLAAGRTEAACGLLRGPFCAGLEPADGRLDEWLAPERARLGERAAGAFGELARCAESDGRMEVAISAAQRLVMLNPFDDAAQARLILLYRRNGWLEAARLAHRRCVALYRRELGILPGEEIQSAARAEPRPTQVRPAALLARRHQVRPRTWWAAAASLVLAAGLAWYGRVQAPMQAEAAPVAWVGAVEWRPDAVPDARGLPLAQAIARGRAGDPEFAHLVPGGC
jgi:DNA-binding SARP family transcriptional activator